MTVQPLRMPVNNGGKRPVFQLPEVALVRWACAHAGSALTTFNKGDCNLNPKVIAHRSSATRGEMLVNSKAFRQFCLKAKINDNVRHYFLPAPAVHVDCPASVIFLSSCSPNAAGLKGLQKTADTHLCAAYGAELHSGFLCRQSCMSMLKGIC